MGPLDVFLGWQAILVAILTYMTTQLVKTVIDLAYAKRRAASSLKTGREERRRSRVLTRIVLPATPPILGAFLALVLPLPDSLAAWSGGQTLWLALVARAAWGAACGQFSSYLYDRTKDLFRKDERRHPRDSIPSPDDEAQ